MSPWWKKLSSRGRQKPAPPQGPPTPYEITCPCGQTHRGIRQPERQVFSCAGCGEPVFVLPLSYWPLVRAAARPQDGSLEGGRAEPPRSAQSSPWLMPLAGALVTLVVVGVLLGGLLYLGRTPREREATQRLTDHIAAARRAMASGEWMAACEEARRALAASAGVPARALVPQEIALAEELSLQADLLANLVDRPLEELLAEAQSLEAADWRRRWETQYKDRGVVFESNRLPDDPRRAVPIAVPYALPQDKGPARIELRHLRPRPSITPSDKAIGVRLASLRPEEPDGVWVIRFDPASALWFDVETGRALRGMFGIPDAVDRADPPAVGMPLGRARSATRQFVSDRYREQWFYEARYLDFQGRKGQAPALLSNPAGLPSPPGIP